MPRPKTRTILILPSGDGDRYTYAVLTPLGMPWERADALLHRILEKVSKANPDDWNWDDAKLHLLKAGFELPRHEVSKGSWDCY